MKNQVSLSPSLAVYLAYFYLSVHNPAPLCLSSPHVREEQKGAKAREPLSLKGDGISELNDKLKEAFREQGGGVSFLYPHTTLGRKAPVCYTQERLEINHCPKLGTPTVASPATASHPVTWMFFYPLASLPRWP